MELKINEQDPTKFDIIAGTIEETRTQEEMWADLQFCKDIERK